MRYYLILCIIIIACSGANHGKNEPRFDEGTLEVKTRYRTQIQNRDFNGVFILSQRGGQIVPAFWKRKFNELTRPGYYSEFFLTFSHYQKQLGEAYKTNIRKKKLCFEALRKVFSCFVRG